MKLTALFFSFGGFVAHVQGISPPCLDSCVRNNGGNTECPTVLANHELWNQCVALTCSGSEDEFDASEIMMGLRIDCGVNDNVPDVPTCLIMCAAMDGVDVAYSAPTCTQFLDYGPQWVNCASADCASTDIGTVYQLVTSVQDDCLGEMPACNKDSDCGMGWQCSRPTTTSNQQRRKLFGDHGHTGVCVIELP